MTTIPILDTSLLDQLREIDPGFVKDLVATFLEDAPKRLQLLGIAVADRQCDAIRLEAHGLKGSALGIGAARMASVCQAIEHAAQAGSLDEAVACFTGLDEEFQTASRALQDLE
jgi:HPt (histidine-containing phosphotransfer) domain-containing protein